MSKDVHIPYGTQNITDEDIKAVNDTLLSRYLTQGPGVESFESEFANVIGNPFCVATSSATSGLHLAYLSLGLKPGHTVWTTPNTFVATANAAKYIGAEVDFVDINPNSFCMSVKKLEEKLVQAKRDNCLPYIVTPVHFAGQSCNMKEIHKLSKKYNFKIVEDAAHAVGASYNNKKIGNCEFSDACVFSFHPVKIITTGEGGLVTFKSQDHYKFCQQALTHGITKDPEVMTRPPDGTWHYEMQFLGFNYRITDIQCALGLSQLKRLESNIRRREEIVTTYHKEFEGLPFNYQSPNSEARSSWHLFVILLENKKIRKELYDYLRSKNIYVQVHYIPVHTQPYYINLGFEWGDFPESENYYNRCLSLPMYHGLSNDDQDYVIKLIKDYFS